MLKYYAGIGSRETPANVCTQMTTLARELRERDWVLRSGKAPGADQAFGRGAGYLAEIWKPWASFEGYDPYDLVPPGLDVVGQSDEDGWLPPTDPWTKTMWLEAMSEHPNWNSLSQGAQKLMVRNGFQIYGAARTEPVSSFIVCWALLDAKGKPKGGTSQAIRLARQRDIPVFNLYETPLELVRKYIENIERKL